MKWEKKHLNQKPTSKPDQDKRLIKKILLEYWSWSLLRSIYENNNPEQGFGIKIPADNHSLGDSQISKV